MKIILIRDNKNEKENKNSLRRSKNSKVKISMGLKKP